MRLTNVTIRNFRCIRELSLDLDNTTILIGENNTGKTAVLEAVRACLDLRSRGRRQFDEYDYRLAYEGASPTEAEPIDIQLSFVESDAEPWATEVGQTLHDLIVLDSDDRKRVTFHVTSQFQKDANDFITDWNFLNAEGNPLLGSARSTGQLGRLKRLVPVFYLSALRDASRHFTAGGRFWRSFLSELGLPEDERHTLETELAALNDRVVEAHGPLAEVRGQLETAKDVIDFGSAKAVVVEALPTKLFALLSGTQVHIKSPSGAKVPLAAQGEGTQSLTVLLLFRAYLRSQLSGLDRYARAVIALEEPEAHLHPSATRALMQIVRELPGQKLISTHNGHLLSGVNASAIRRLAYAGGDIKAYRISVDALSAEETRKFDAHVKRSRGELLFAKCWLLVEGESEVILLTGIAEILGFNLDRAGIYCVEYSQSDVGMLAKVANQLGIAWYCVIDDDSGRTKYENRVRAQVGDAGDENRIAISYRNVELLLCENDLGDLYESRMPRQKEAPTAQSGTHEYWQQVIEVLPRGFSKPEAAAEAVDRMAESKTVPRELKDILLKAQALAEAL